MMPYCDYKRCKKVAEKKLGVVVEYHHPYLCMKHFKKVLSLLNIKYRPDGDYR